MEMGHLMSQNTINIFLLIVATKLFCKCVFLTIFSTQSNGAKPGFSSFENIFFLLKYATQYLSYILL